MPAQTIKALHLAQIPSNASAYLKRFIPLPLNEAIIMRTISQGHHAQEAALAPRTLPPKLALANAFKTEATKG